MYILLIILLWNCKPYRNFDASLSYRTLFSLPDNQTKDFKIANTTADLMDASLSYRTSFSLPDNQTNDFKKANTTPDLMDGTERSK